MSSAEEAGDCFNSVLHKKKITLESQQKDSTTVDQKALISYRSNVIYFYHIQVPLCYTARVAVTE
jgi:hypothetical protein